MSSKLKDPEHDLLIKGYNSYNNVICVLIVVSVHHIIYIYFFIYRIDPKEMAVPKGCHDY